MIPRIHMSGTGQWSITGIDADEATEFLRKHSPWRMELSFDGVSSADFGTYQPFNRAPLRKLKEILDIIPNSDLQGGRVLDVGFNVGYNSLYLAQEFRALATGIDVVRTHKETSDELARMLGLNAEFLLESAETFQRPNTFDLVLHLGTLYHLANPIMSIDRCARSLKPGGWFALETMCYRGSSDPTACDWIYGLGGDNTNFWSLGEGAIRSMVARSGIMQFDLILEVSPATYNGRHSRTIWVGRKEK